MLSLVSAYWILMSLLLLVHSPEKFFFFPLWFDLCCPTLYVLYLLAFVPPHSLPSKCWHISFKWSVFISHSLFPSSLLPLWGEAECVLEGSIPRQPHRCFASSYLSPPLSFLSPPSVSSDIYCQRLDVCMHLSKALFCRQLSVAYHWFL